MEIKSAEFITSMAEYTDRFPGAGLRQVAICGKSNVGKSSLINRLCRRNKLARTSSTPGKTRLINVFLLNGAFHLIDLPGYGFAKVDKQEKLRWGEMMQRSFTESKELCHVLHLVDIRHAPTADGYPFYGHCHQGGQNYPGRTPKAAGSHLSGAAGTALGNHLLFQ